MSEKSCIQLSSSKGLNFPLNKIWKYLICSMKSYAYKRLASSTPYESNYRVVYQSCNFIRKNRAIFIRKKNKDNLISIMSFKNANKYLKVHNPESANGGVRYLLKQCLSSWCNHPIYLIYSNLNILQSKKVIIPLEKLYN